MRSVSDFNRIYQGNTSSYTIAAVCSVYVLDIGSCIGLCKYSIFTIDSQISRLLLRKTIPENHDSGYAVVVSYQFLHGKIYFGSLNMKSLDQNTVNQMIIFNSINLYLCLALSTLNSVNSIHNHSSATSDLFDLSTHIVHLCST